MVEINKKNERILQIFSLMFYIDWIILNENKVFCIRNSGAEKLP